MVGTGLTVVVMSGGVQSMMRHYKRIWTQPDQCTEHNYLNEELSLQAIVSSISGGRSQWRQRW